MQTDTNIDTGTDPNTHTHTHTHNVRAYADTAAVPDSYSFHESASINHRVLLGVITFEPRWAADINLLATAIHKALFMFMLMHRQQQQQELQRL